MFKLIHSLYKYKYKYKYKYSNSAVRNEYIGIELF